MSLREPIIEGAYYLREDGVIAPAIKGPLVSTCTVAGHVVYRDRGVSFSIGGPSLTRRVWITHTDPAEVVAELRRMESNASNRHAYDDLSRGQEMAYESAADLVAEKLVGGK